MLKSKKTKILSLSKLELLQAQVKVSYSCSLSLIQRPGWEPNSVPDFGFGLDCARQSFTFLNRPVNWCDICCHFLNVLEISIQSSAFRFKTNENIVFFTGFTLLIFRMPQLSSMCSVVWMIFHTSVIIKYPTRAFSLR